MTTFNRFPVFPLAAISAFNFLLPVPLVAAPKPESTQVVPGRSLGKISLGFTPIQVRKAMGKPDKTITLRSGHRDDVYLSKKTRVDQNGEAKHDKLEILYLKDKVVQIEATSPSFRTATGLSTNSTVSQLTRSSFRWRVLVYGYESEDNGWQNFYFMDRKRGLSIEFQGWQEKLFRRSYPSTLIVHRAQSQVIPDAGGELVTDSTDLSVVMSEQDSN